MQVESSPLPAAVPKATPDDTRVEKGRIRGSQVGREARLEAREKARDVDLRVPRKLRNDMRILQREQRQLGKVLGRVQDFTGQLDLMRRIRDEASSLARSYFANRDDPTWADETQQALAKLQADLEEIAMETKFPGARAARLVGEVQVSSTSSAFIGAMSAFVGPDGLRRDLFGALLDPGLRLDDRASAGAMVQQLFRVTGRMVDTISALSDVYERAAERIEARLGEIETEIANVSASRATLRDAGEADELARATRDEILGQLQGAPPMHIGLPSAATLGKLLG